MLCSTQTNQVIPWADLTSKSSHSYYTHTITLIQSRCFSHPFPLKEGRKEGNVSFNDALNTFYLRLYGVGHMVKDHSYSEKGNTLLPHRLLFAISSKGSFICTIPQRIAHTTAFVTPVVEHWLEQEIAQWVHSMKDLSDDPSHHEQTLLPRSYISLVHFH